MPYLNRTTQDAKGEMVHEGFIIDLLDLLKARLGFNYTVYEVADRNFGMKLKDGKWDGMIGDLMRENDVRITPQLSIRVYLNRSLSTLYSL